MQKKIKTQIISIILTLFVSLLLYEAFLYDNMLTEQDSNLEFTSSMLMENFKTKISLLMKMGIELERNSKVNTYLQQLGKISHFSMAVVTFDGRILSKVNDYPELQNFVRHTSNIESRIKPFEQLQTTKPNTNHYRIFKDADGRYFFGELYFKNTLSGYISVFLPEQFVTQKVKELFLKQLTIHALGFICCVVLIVLTGMFMQGTVKRVQVISGSIALLFFLMCGVHSIIVSSKQYTASLNLCVNTVGSLLAADLDKLMFAGIDLTDIAQIDAYLKQYVQGSNGALHVSIIDSDGNVVARSIDSQTKILESISFFLHASQQRPDDLLLNVSIEFDQIAFVKKCVAVGLDILTILVTAVIFMLEITISESRVQEIRTANASYSLLLRPIMFVAIFAMDMTLSFIPLQMGTFVDAHNPANALLLSFPVSFEMAGVGISILLAGPLLKKFPISPMILAWLVMGFGYFGSMLAQTGWQFIGARAIVGLGYGFGILTAQVLTVEKGLIADMFAGVYAGSLCGVAMGGMLADRLGYSSIFGIAGIIFFGLVVVLWLGVCLQKNRPQSLLALFGLAVMLPSSTQMTAQKDVSTRKRLWPLFKSKGFTAFMGLHVLLILMLEGGLQNYYWPIYLHDANFSQSDIGRIFMFSSIFVIFCSQPCATWFDRFKSKGLPLLLTAICMSSALLVLIILPPLFAAIVSAITLGLGVAMRIPTMSSYLLTLQGAQKTGVELCMSVSEVVQRIGQTLGPIVLQSTLLLLGTAHGIQLIGGLIVTGTCITLYSGRK